MWVADLGRARRVAERENAPLDGADYLETTIIGFVDTALAAQNAVVASESLGLGTVFVGALRNKPLEVADELGLPPQHDRHFRPGRGCSGPDGERWHQTLAAQEAVLHQEQYDAAAADAHITGYDGSLADYNRRHGLDGTWVAGCSPAWAPSRRCTGGRSRTSSKPEGLPSR